MPTPTPDFSIFDGRELISYVAVSGPTFVDVPAVRRPLTQSRQRNVERYVELQATDVVFHMDATLFESASLAAGDTISDITGTSYTVLFVEWQTLKNTVVAVCRPVV